MKSPKYVAFGFLLLGIQSIGYCQRSSLPAVSRTTISLHLPDCALLCLVSAINNSTCAVTDQSCICTNQDLNAHAETCIEASCTVREQLTTKNQTEAECGTQRPRSGTDCVPIFTTFLGLAAGAVGLRLIARCATHCCLWWDDLFIFLAFAGCTGYAVTNLRALQIGMGKDIWQVPFDDITWNLVIYWTNMILYCLTRGLVRFSILAFYLRLFPVTSDLRIHRLILGTAVLNALHILAFLLAIVFMCWPVSFFWHQWESAAAVDQHQQHVGRCVNANAVAWAASAVGIAFDLWLICLPWIGLWKVNLSVKRKMEAGVMLLVGLSFFIVSLIRLKTINTFTTTNNPTRDFVDVGIWSGIEIDVGCVCPCLPAIRLLFLRYWSRWTGATSSKSPYEVQLQASSIARNMILRKQSQGELAKDRVADNLVMLATSSCSSIAGAVSEENRREAYDTATSRLYDIGKM